MVKQKANLYFHYRALKLSTLQWVWQPRRSYGFSSYYPNSMSIGIREEIFACGMQLLLRLFRFLIIIHSAGFGSYGQNVIQRL